MMVSIIQKQSQQNNSCVANEIDTQTHILANNNETRFVWTLDVSLDISNTIESYNCIWPIFFLFLLDDSII